MKLKKKVYAVLLSCVGASIFSHIVLCARNIPIQRLLLTFSKSPNLEDLSVRDCLVRDNQLDAQDVLTVPCTDLTPTSLLRAEWFWFPDGRIRGTNGLCLALIPAKLTLNDTIPPHLQARQCSDDDQLIVYETWTQSDGRLISRGSEPSTYQSDMPLPTWMTSAFSPEPFDADEITSLRYQRLQKDLNTGKLRFAQVARRLPDAARDLAELTSSVEVSKTETDKVNVLLRDIEGLVETIKVDLQGRPTHIGQGVAIEIMESTGSQTPSLTFLSPKFELSGDTLRTLGVSPAGPMTVRVSGYVLAPKDGLYYFTVSDLTSQFRLIVNGVTLINQWAAPALGVVQSQPPLTLKAGDELQIAAVTSGILGTPNFKLQWRIDNQKSPEEIPTESLYPSILQPLCTTGGLIPRIDCAATFNKVRVGSEPVKVQCPSGCLSTLPQPPKVYGTPGCYALHSSVCTAAIHSGVLSERGGTVLVQIDPTMDKAQYPGLPGFLVKSYDAPAAKGCGSIAMPIADGGPMGLYQPTVATIPELAKSGANAIGPWSGMVGIPSGTEALILAKMELGPGYLVDVQLSCGSSSGTSITDESYASSDQLDIMEGVRLRYKTAGRSNVIGITHLTLTKAPANVTVLTPIAGWNRLTCQTLTDTVSLYFKYGHPTDEVPYPSATLTCETLFMDLVSSLPLTSKSFAPVYGLFTYAEKSSVCRAAYHAGVLADAGGTVAVTRLPIRGAVTWSGLRNGIKSAVNDAVEQLFFVHRPAGRKCIYPEHPGGLFHMSMTSPRFEISSSFRQRLRPISPHIANSNLSQLSNDFSFRELQKTNVFDLSHFLEGKSSAVTALKESLSQLGHEQQSQSITLQNYQQVADLVEDMIQKKLRETETRIYELENELQGLISESPPDFTDYARTDRLQDDWLILDAADASLGPSAWKIKTSSEKSTPAGIHQMSSITSPKSPGTHLILRHRQYDKGFITARVQVAEPGYGQFGFIVKYINDQDFIALEISKPSTGASSSIGVRRMRDGNFGPPENVVTYELPSSSWVQLGADFGRHTVRFFVENGKAKTGITLEEPVTGGYVGFFTQALGTDSNLVFDSVMCGPLSSQKALGLSKVFGSESERVTEIAIQTVKGEQPLQEPTAATTLPTVAPFPLNADNALQAEKPAATLSSSEITIKQDVTGCVQEYSDPLLSGVHSAWKPSVTTTSGKTKDTPEQHWSQASSSMGRYLIGHADVFTNEKAGSKAELPSSNVPLLLLNENVCTHGFTTRLSVDLRLKEGARGGLSFRGRTPDDYVVAFFDFVEDTGPRIVVDDVKHGVGQQYSTGTRTALVPDVWYNLAVEDAGSFVRVLLNDETVLQIRLQDNGVGQQGLAVLKGLVDFRNFSFLQSDTSSM